MKGISVSAPRTRPMPFRAAAAILDQIRKTENGGLKNKNTQTKESWVGSRLQIVVRRMSRIGTWRIVIDINLSVSFGYLGSLAFRYLILDEV